MTPEQHEERSKDLKEFLSTVREGLDTVTSRLLATNEVLAAKSRQLEELLSGPEVTLTKEGQRMLAIIKGL